MNPRPKFCVTLFLGAMSLLLGACTTMTTKPTANVDLRRYHVFFVQRPLVDNHFVDEYLVRELERQGREAGSGPLTMKPDHVDAIVTYDDRWQWDFWNYMIELNVEIIDARTDKTLAKCRYYQPSISTKGPADVAHALFLPLFRDPLPPRA